MKKTSTIYWIFTILFAALMVFSSVPDVLSNPDAVTFMHGHLGYPNYFTPFIGVAKLLGVIAILIPGFPRLKEWAYAGFVFDLTGAAYSLIAVGDPFSQWIFMILPIGLCFGSYIYLHKIHN